MESNGFSPERAIGGGGTKLPSAQVAAARQSLGRGKGWDSDPSSVQR
jgi:hypothetical protein